MPNTKNTSRFAHAVNPLNVQPTKEATTPQNVGPRELNEKEYLKHLTVLLNKQNAEIEFLKKKKDAYELAVLVNQQQAKIYSLEDQLKSAQAENNDLLKNQQSSGLKNSHAFYNGNSHLFTLNDETAVNLYNCIARFFYCENIEDLPITLEVERSLLFDFLEAAVSNSDIEDSTLKGLFVARCGMFIEFLNIGFKLYSDRRNLRS